MTFSGRGLITESLKAIDAMKKHESRKKKEFGIIHAVIHSRKDSSYDENIGSNQ
jgi:hypothetical protein